MSTTVAITNYSLRKFVTKYFAPMATSPTVTKTKSIRSINHDDMSVNFDDMAKRGVTISENGTLRAGNVVVTGAASITTAQHVVIVDMTGDMTLGLPALADCAVGHTITIYLRSRSAGTLTVDGAAAETVLGSANKTYTTAGSILRIKKGSSSTNWVAQT